jgi:hypothetical protein
MSKEQYIQKKRNRGHITNRPANKFIVNVVISHSLLKNSQFLVYIGDRRDYILGKDIPIFLNEVVPQDHKIIRITTPAPDFGVDIELEWNEINSDYVKNHKEFLDLFKP